MSYTFLPWLRQGIGAEVAALTDGAGTLPLLLNDAPLGTGLPVRLLGPADVVGIDPAQVVRTDPVPAATGVEPNYFPLVEFDEPALPWLFSPGAPDQRNRLRPWLVLVVVRAKAGVTLDPDPQRRMSVLTIEAPARPGAELPDLAESWAWAHVQVTGPVGAAGLAPVLTDHPERTLARLLCPRRLDRLTGYLACVVPAYAGGRAAGLGEPDPDEPNADAWRPGDARVRLPVYHYWEFSTGEAGDFESLAARLSAADGVPAGVGERALGLRGSGFPVPVGEPEAVPFGGALGPPEAPPVAGPAWFAAGVAGLLDAADARSVVPPRYGAQQTGATALPAAGWQRQLNLDPRHRAAAGLGARFVQDNQERLVELAWQQAGELAETNRFLARTQLGDEVARSVWQHRLTALAAAEPATLVQVAAPGRLTGGDLALRALAAGSGPAALSPAYRRLTRPRGPVARSGMTIEGMGAPAGMGAGQVLAELTPEAGRSARLAAQLAPATDVDPMARPDPAAPLLRPPEFRAPLATELQRLSPEHVVPGAEHVPPDTVLLLAPDKAFIAAFLAGANHEMGRELLWREFPTRLDATYFPVFWDRRGQADPDASADDIRPIAEWDPAQPLGAGVTGTPDDGIVMVVRGELLLRYPRAVVHAVRAVRDGAVRRLADENVPGNRLLPRFGGFLEPDIRFFGFGLSAADARGDADGLGWFFVLAEQPTEPRFGLDVVAEAQFTDPPVAARPDGTLAPALPSAALGWGHLVAAAGFPALVHAPVAAARPANWWFPDRPAVGWAGGAADLAVLTLQRPARVGLHAARLLEPP